MADSFSPHKFAGKSETVKKAEGRVPRVSSLQETRRGGKRGGRKDAVAKPKYEMSVSECGPSPRDSKSMVNFKKDLHDGNARIIAAHACQKIDHAVLLARCAAREGYSIEDWKAKWHHHRLALDQSAEAFQPWGFSSAGTTPTRDRSPPCL